MKYDVITIEREYASGGREIGQKLAQKLNIPYYGREILMMAAKEIGAEPEYVEHMDETAPNSLLFSLYAMSSTVPFDSAKVSPENALQQAESRIIKDASIPCEGNRYVIVCLIADGIQFLQRWKGK